MLLKVGTRVLLSEAGRDNWENEEENPHHTTGRISQVKQDYRMPYQVQWSNGYHNDYFREDLEFSQE